MSDILELNRAVDELKHKRNQDDASKLIYDRTNKVALAVIRKYCSNPNEYEDILQKTYLTVYTKIQDLRDDSKLQAWINQIAANTAIRHNKQLHAELFTEMTDEEGNDKEFADENPSSQPDAIYDRLAVVEAVNDIMKTLPLDQQNIMWMVYGQGIKIKDAAQELGLSENTIKSRLRQGRLKMESKKDEFRKYGIELTLIPVSVLIAMAFEQDVYAATGSVLLSAAAKATAEGAKNAAESAGVNAAGTSAAATAGGKAGLSIGVKALAGVVAAGAIAGGVYLGTQKPKVDIKYLDVSEVRWESDGSPFCYKTMGYEFTNEGNKASSVITIHNTDYRENSIYKNETIYDDYEKQSVETYTYYGGEVEVITYDNVYEGDLLVSYKATSNLDGAWDDAVFQYDEDGNRIQEHYPLNQQDYASEYSDDGQLIKRTGYAPRNQIYKNMFWEYEYDETGQCISMRTERGNFTYTYEYSDDKAWRKKTAYKDDVLYTVTFSVSRDYLIKNPDTECPWEIESLGVKESDFLFIEGNSAESIKNSNLEMVTSEISEPETEEEQNKEYPEVSIGEDLSYKHVTINGVTLRFPIKVSDFLSVGLSFTDVGTGEIEQSEYYNVLVEGGELGLLVTNPYYGYGEFSRIPFEDCYINGILKISDSCPGKGFELETGVHGNTAGDALVPELSEGSVPTTFPTPDNSTLPDGRVYYIWGISEPIGDNFIEYYYTDESELITDMVVITYALGIEQ